MKGLIDLSLVNGIWTLKLSMIQTVALAIVTLYLGEFIKKHSTFLQRVSMPAPAVGGLPFYPTIKLLILSSMVPCNHS